MFLVSPKLGSPDGRRWIRDRPLTSSCGDRNHSCADCELVPRRPVYDGGPGRLPLLLSGCRRQLGGISPPPQREDHLGGRTSMGGPGGRADSVVTQRAAPDVGGVFFELGDSAWRSARDRFPCNSFSSAHERIFQRS